MNSIKWNELEHAYGNASDIPELLQQLKSYPSCKNYDDEPFYTLWGSLCHKGDVYSASYAAVPVIVSLIENAPNKVDYNYFLLPVCIEIARLKGNGPQIHESIKNVYFSAIDTMANLASKIQSPNENMVSVLAATIAVRHGNAELSEAILELTPDVLMEFQQWLADR